MARLEWSAAVRRVIGNLVRIETHGDGYGSGFIIPPPANTAGSCCVLTAFHVIKQAYITGATITIRKSGGDYLELPSLMRNVFCMKERDQAIISFNAPSGFDTLGTVDFLSRNFHCNPGVELGWLGFPRLEKARDIPCFLSGRISAFLPNEEAYLIDGVSIHGMSGGPAFYCDNAGKVILAGIVTNYFPNEVNNQLWPGLAMFRTINPLMELYEAQDKSPMPAFPDPPAGGQDPGKSTNK